MRLVMADRVLLFHLDPSEAEEHTERLRREGFATECFAGNPGDGRAYRRILENPPDGLIIDLNRRPAHGRELAIYFRGQKATRGAALVFIEGDPEKTAHVRSLLPDAVFTTWRRIAPSLRRALKNRPEKPVVPGTFAGYSGTPLPQKLRIRAGCVVGLAHAPQGFESKLDPLPEGVRIGKDSTNADVILAFFKSEGNLTRELPALIRAMREGRTLWLIWPKKASGVVSDLAEPKVREIGLAAGLVDYKICAVDETWSGLAFALRKAKRVNAP